MWMIHGGRSDAVVPGDSWPTSIGSFEGSTACERFLKVQISLRHGISRLRRINILAQAIPSAGALKFNFNVFTRPAGHPLLTKDTLISFSPYKISIQ